MTKMIHGSKVKNSNFISQWPYFDNEEIEAVVKVLRSGKVNQWTGSEVTRFEKEYARYVGVNHGVALMNGSVALDLALTTLGIGPGDEVIVTPRTFIASVSCAILKGATPVFVDVDRESQNMRVDAVKDACSPRTKAVIAVHLAGWPCELDELRSVCDEKGIYLIEDCAQAHGAFYYSKDCRDKGKNTKKIVKDGASLSPKPVGSFGDIATFSFCQDKIITTGGEGGLLLTNNSELWEKAWRFKDHGKDYNKSFGKNQNSHFRWLIESIGTNYRMTEMQAAIGRVMLRKLEKLVRQRRRLVDILNKGFQDIPGLRLTCPPEHVYHSYCRYYAFVRPEMLRKGWSRDRILKTLVKKGIPCGTGICPEVYLEEVFKKDQFKFKISGDGSSRLPVAKELGETSMMFFVHSTLGEENMCFLIDQMKKVMGEAVK